MRSRFTAYALGNVDYLLATHDPKQPADRASVEAWARRAKFTALEVRATEGGGPEDQTGVVEFVAHFEEDGRAREHHERSRFARIDGRWHYLDGRAPALKKPKVGRNDPCPCGSGKKHKKCCGA